ncbi:hypothetical protein [Cellulophaga lytica]|uniref:hypothetical protein n=1 Tax=Cellulophaga lytica TaxID=979 RepID=UPI000B5C8C1E|nr:hypothetical protein [Cellulophaga lytica]MDO6852407.1 hypothetical protein [Cellulophaga lytica]SNQ42764.1 hypothetical protein CL8139_190254 [Cellulophaga lytica]
MTKPKSKTGIENWNADGLHTQTQSLCQWTFQSDGFRNWTLILILLISISSCKNVKTESSCDFDFFEKTSGFEFPKKIQIIDCYDSLEGIIWVHLKFDPKTASEFILQTEMHQYTDKIENELFKLHGSEDDQMIRSLTTFMNDSIQPITKNRNTYLKSVERKHQYVIYVINKDSGYFWGLIQYPDWSGD